MISRRLVAGALAATMLLAACGASDSDAGSADRGAEEAGDSLDLSSGGGGDPEGPPPPPPSASARRQAQGDAAPANRDASTATREPSKGSPVASTGPAPPAPPSPTTPGSWMRA